MTGLGGVVAWRVDGRSGWRGGSGRCCGPMCWRPVGAVLRRDWWSRWRLRPDVLMAGLRDAAGW